MESTALESLSAHVKSDREGSIRSILELSSSDMNRLSDLLLTGIVERVETNAAVLPGTYDDEANNEAMQSTSSALTLTKTSLTAARVYAQLLECGICLQKLVGLCKGEGIVSGLSGSIAQRQKTFLKDFLEAVFRAADAIGASQL